MHAKTLTIAFAVATAAFLLTGCGAHQQSASPAPTSSIQPTPPQPTTAPSGPLLFLVAMGYSSNLYVVNADGSGLTQLLDSPESDAPGAFSPDGSLIAYNSDLRDDGAPDGVYVMSSDGSNAHSATGGDSCNWFISWSSQGRILCGEGVTGSARYWVTDPDSSSGNPISEWTTGSWPDWSPDGENLLLHQCIASPDNPQPCTLSIIDQRGNPVRTLMQNANDISSPRWSPDGKQILFIRTQADTPDTLVVMNADDTNIRNLYQFPSGANWSDAKWSPDGSQIAAWTNTQIAVVSTVDGNSHIVTTGNTWDGFAWSPDSTRIAYVSNDDAKVHVVDTSGEAQAQVIADVASGNVSWSPNGGQILFASNRKRQGGVWWSSPDGSQRGRLDALSATWVPPSVPTVEAVGGCRKGSIDNSCLSPDGNFEASIAPNDTVLKIEDLATGAGRAINLGENIWDGPPVWSSDGTKIAIYAYDSAVGGLYLVDVASGQSQLLVKGARTLGFEPGIAWSPDGSYVYYTKGMVCGEGCAPGFLYRIRTDGTGEERVIDMRIDAIYGFAP